MSDPADIESWLAKSQYSSVIIFDAQTGYLICYDNYAYGREGMKCTP